MRFADVGDNIWVGEYRACDAHLHEFDLSVHIWKPLNWTEKRFCKRCHGSTKTHGGTGLAIEWHEGQRLYQMSVPVDEFVEYVKRPGRLFIHCARGICRSTTLALVAKTVRGGEVFQAVKEIYSHLYDQYGNPPDWVPKTIEDVLYWAHGRLYKNN